MKCSYKFVRDGGRWPSFHQCKRNAVVERGSQPYCKVHDPKAVTERQKVRAEAWNISFNRRMLGGYAPALVKLLQRSKTEGNSVQWQRDRNAILRQTEKLLGPS